MSLIPYLTRIHFADRVLEDALPEEIARLGLRRVLLMADAFGTGHEPAERVDCALPVQCSVQAVRAEAALPDPEALWHAAGCDGIVAVGGPVALETALAVAAPGRKAGHLPVIAVPTTTAGLGLPAVPVKAPGIGRANCPPMPSVVLCDPTLTLWAGSAVTAAAGMDVVLHCMETFLSTTWNPPADAMALDGLRRAARWLDTAVAEGSHLTARREMLAAALNAGLAGQKGLGAAHALARALEAELPPDTPHGSLHAALIPATLRFNAPAAGERYDALAEALRLAPGTDLALALRDLGGRLGLAVSLSALPLTAAQAARIAVRAAEDMANRTNPRHATVADHCALLAEAAA
jgi:4-hydroxybutyrate dehydrogenase